MSTHVSVDADHLIECQTDDWRRLDAILSEPRITTIPSLRLSLEFYVSLLTLDSIRFGLGAFIRLRTLDIRPCCDVNLLNAVDTVSDSLETLSFRINSCTEAFNAVLSGSSGVPKYFFRPLSRLRTLHLRLDRASHQTESSFIRHLTCFLSLSTLPSSLQFLDFGTCAHFFVDVDHLIECHCRQSDHWRRLDSILKPRFTAVPILRLSLEFYGLLSRCEVSFIARTRKLVEEVLPVFRQTRLLSMIGQLSGVCRVFCKPLTLQNWTVR